MADRDYNPWLPPSPSLSGSEPPKTSPCPAESMLSLVPRWQPLQDGRCSQVIARLFPALLLRRGSHAPAPGSRWHFQGGALVHCWGDTTPAQHLWDKSGLALPARKMKITFFPSPGADGVCLAWINVCKALGSAGSCAEMGGFVSF